MTFETAEDVPFAGTDAVVYVQLFGENGQTEKIEFKSDSKIEAPKFKRGRIDKFAVETADVGKVTWFECPASYLVCNLNSYMRFEMQEKGLEKIA